MLEIIHDVIACFEGIVREIIGARCHHIDIDILDGIVYFPLFWLDNDRFEYFWRWDRLCSFFLFFLV